MFESFNRFLDALSEYLADRKGLLPSVGLLLVIVSLILNLFPGNWLTETDILLHLGVVVAILGFLLAWAL